jgi:Tfp pilus assembly protein PilF
LKARKDLSAERALSGANAAGVTHSRDQIKDKDVARELERSQRLHRSDDELQEDLRRLEARYADESSPETMIELADVHEKLKDPESALDWVERALSYKKDSFELAARAGDLRAKVMKKKIAQAGKSGDDARASELERELWSYEAADYTRRVDLRPSDANLRLQLGRRLMRVGDFDGAMGQLQKAMSDPRTKREAQFCLAQCFQGKGFSDLARKEYQKALEGILQVDDRAKEILYNLGVIAQGEGNAAEARGFFARIFEVDIGYRDVAEKMNQYK